MRAGHYWHAQGQDSLPPTIVHSATVSLHVIAWSLQIATQHTSCLVSKRLEVCLGNLTYCKHHLQWGNSSTRCFPPGSGCQPCSLWRSRQPSFQSWCPSDAASGLTVYTASRHRETSQGSWPSQLQELSLLFSKQGIHGKACDFWIKLRTHFFQETSSILAIQLWNTTTIDNRSTQ